MVLCLVHWLVGVVFPQSMHMGHVHSVGRACTGQLRVLMFLKPWWWRLQWSEL